MKIPTTSLHITVCFLVSVVLLAFTQSEYATSEDLGIVEVCVQLILPPEGSLECNLAVTLGLQDGAKAGI